MRLDSHINKTHYIHGGGQSIESNRDYRTELIEALRTAGEAVEEAGYQHHGYYFRVPHHSDFQEANPDAEAGLDELLESLRGEDLNRLLQGDMVVPLFEGDPDNYKVMVDQMLSHIEGGLDVEPQDSPVHPGLLDVVYKIRSDGNYFENTNRGGPGSEEYIKDIEEILQNKGFEVREP